MTSSSATTPAASSSRATTSAAPTPSETTSAPGPGAPIPGASAAPQTPGPDRAGEPPTSGVVELSVVLPCLNEAETLATCIRKATRSFATLGVVGEVVVADNGSTDGSQDIARRRGRASSSTSRGAATAPR